MSAGARSLGRNVHIYNANHPDTVLGGLVLNNGVTNANLYSMVGIIFRFDEYNYILRLRNEAGIVIQDDNNPLQPGNYYILTSGTLLPRFIVNC